MKLFLSSEGVPRPDLLRALMGIGSERVRVALINNAQDPYPEDIAKERGESLEELFESLNFDPMTVDLREYVGREEELLESLRSCKLVWCAGGNVFWLRYVMKHSGFDTALPILLAEGLVYGGWSAGAVVAATTMHPIELMDDPNTAPEVIYEGLGLMDFLIWPHWDNPKYEHLQTEAIKRMAGLSYECLTLKDGEVVIVENGRRSITR